MDYPEVNLINKKQGWRECGYCVCLKRRSVATTWGSRRRQRVAGHMTVDLHSAFTSLLPLLPTPKKHHVEISEEA